MGVYKSSVLSKEFMGLELITISGMVQGLGFLLARSMCCAWDIERQVLHQAQRSRVLGLRASLRKLRSKNPISPSARSTPASSR